MDIAVGAATVTLVVATAVSLVSVLWERRRRTHEEQRLLIRREHMDLALRTEVNQLLTTANELRRAQEAVIYSPRLLGEVPRGSQADNVVGGEDRSLPGSAVAEIAHSLGTPLSQIEVGLSRLGAVDLSAEGAEEELGQIAQSIAASVEVSKAFLLSFREISSLESSTSGWEPGSLTSAISSAVELYKEKARKPAVRVLLQLPEQLNGYSNSFAMAVLLPLIENAIEGAPDGSSVEVADSYEKGNLVLTVSNRCVDPEGLSSEIYVAGKTTKSGHAGLGLAVVRRLVTSRGGGSLNHSLRGGTVQFHVSLPAPI